METKLFRFAKLLFDGVEENFSEIKELLESRGIYPEKMTEEIFKKIAKFKVQQKIEYNKKLLNEFESSITDKSSDQEIDYKAAANFRKKVTITESDVNSVQKDQKLLKLLEENIMQKEDERTSKSSSEKNT